MEHTIQRAVESYLTAMKADREFRGSLCAAVDALPQNPDIVSIKDSPCTFYTNFKSIIASGGHIMDPGYHNFTEQKRTLTGVVSETENYRVMMEKLQGVADKGRIKNDPSIFHPLVKQHMARIMSQFPNSEGISEEMRG